MANAAENAKTDHHEIIQSFQQMRNEQRTLMDKISELEQDMNEHNVVIETLEVVSPQRKCFRMIGGVLVEKTVEEILPALVHNKTQLTKLIASLNEKMVEKGKQLNEFRDKHGIRIRGQEGPEERKGAAAVKGTAKEGSSATTGVLVSNSAS